MEPQANRYENLPQSVKDYADFVCNMYDLQQNSGLYGVQAMEDQRVELHERMAEEYGIRYEYTRTATASVCLNIEHMTPERVAIAVDWNLRYVKGMYEAARTDNKLDDFEKTIDKHFSELRLESSNKEKE